MAAISRLQPEQPDAFRARSRHRHRRRRRHRRGRGGGAPHRGRDALPTAAAAYKAMQEVSGPVIAVGLVLSAVFVPCAFISGITGQFFRQFALTIAVSTVISAFNSLTLSPALAAILLAAADAAQGHLRPGCSILRSRLVLPPGLFNWGFRHTTNGYTPHWSSGHQRSAAARRILVLYGGLLALDLVKSDLQANAADGLHPQPGPGQAVRGGTAARRCLERADAGGR